MWNYDNLSDKELDSIRKEKLGEVLKSVKEIGRMAVIEKLRELDTLMVMRSKYMGFIIPKNKNQEKIYKKIRRYVLWGTSNIKNYISLKDFMGIK